MAEDLVYCRRVRFASDSDFSKKIKGGFSIGPQNGSWYISMSDESFKALISEYLRPVTKKLLFG